MFTYQYTCIYSTETNIMWSLRPKCMLNKFPKCDSVSYLLLRYSFLFVYDAPFFIQERLGTTYEQ